jgi:chromosome segregation ATPase
MGFITRGILRWGLIGGLAIGGLTLLVGPERVCAGLSQIRMKAQNVVDQCVDDPVALRRQLEQLAGEYPERIAEVRGELAAVETQVSQFTRDSDVARRVVALTTQDLGELRQLVARAEAEVKTGTRPVALRFDGVKLDITEAYTEARRINSVRESYRDRLACNDQQMNLLTQQKQRLTDILAKLEQEFSTFQAQLWQLDRQIDAIERNERLIEMTREMEATLADYGKFEKVGNLRQLEAKLKELQTYQQAQIEALEKRGIHGDYENKAKYELEAGDSANPMDDPFRDLDQPSTPADDAATVEQTRSLVWNSPVVIE